MTKSMLYAEQQSSNITTNRYEWSPVLAQAIHTVRFW